ncbi:hypothetical protein [Streptomyces sp. NPDC098781]|uniref:hypothetical protein n=1 Tax=Streptomyces sp. NPDC098781 TaxID=3366097 RepID=UPI003804D9C0
MTVLAARALGNRDQGGYDEDDALIAAHLSWCVSCQAEQEEFARIAGLLSEVALHELDGIPVPDPEPVIAALRRADLPEYGVERRLTSRRCGRLMVSALSSVTERCAKGSPLGPRRRRFPPF